MADAISNHLERVREVPDGQSSVTSIWCSVMPKPVASLSTQPPSQLTAPPTSRFARCHRVLDRIFGRCRNISNRDGSNALVGRTISPTLPRNISKHLDLSGTGVIIGVKNLSPKHYRVVEHHTIAPLHLTPVRNPDVKRTPGECVIDALVTARHLVQDKPALARIEETLRSTWLDSDMAPQSARNALSLAKTKAPEEAGFHKAIDAICASMQTGLYITRRNDNLYGRLFETHLSEYLVKHPDDGMLRVRDHIASALVHDLQSYSPSAAQTLCDDLAVAIRADPAPWRSDIGDVQRFLELPSRTTLLTLLRNDGDRSVPLLLSVAVKYALQAPNFERVRQEATAFYASVILPQRNLVTGKNSQDPLSDMHGLLLPWQRGAHPSAATADGIGIRPMDRYIRPDDESGLSMHDLKATNAERTIGIGMSGSTNMLDYVFRDIARGKPEFPMTSAQLATAAWVAHSGGHSFNEVYSVFGYRPNKYFAPLSFNDFALTSYTADEAVTYAFNHVTDTAQKLLDINGIPGLAP